MSCTKKNAIRANEIALSEETDPYLLEIGKAKIMDLKEELNNFRIYKSQTKSLLSSNLKNQIKPFQKIKKTQTNQLSFSGTIEYLIIE